MKYKDKYNFGELSFAEESEIYTGTIDYSNKTKSHRACIEIHNTNQAEVLEIVSKILKVLNDD